MPEKNKKIIYSLFLLLAVLLLPTVVFGAGEVPRLSGLSSLFGTATLAQIIIRVIQFFLGILGLIFVGLLLYAGFNWMTSQGDPNKVLKAKQTIYQAIIGMIIIFSAFAITSFLFAYFGPPDTIPQEACDNPGETAYCSAGSCDGYRICGEDHFWGSCELEYPLNCSGIDSYESYKPEITYIDPAFDVKGNTDRSRITTSTVDDDLSNGAKGNLITIYGRYFGYNAGKVYFVDRSSNARVEAVVAPCDDPWSNNQIIVLVPTAGITANSVTVDSGVPLAVPIYNYDVVVVKNPASATPLESLPWQFQVNQIERPGICSMVPKKGIHPATTTVSGIKFPLSGTQNIIWEIRPYVVTTTGSEWTAVSTVGEVPDGINGKSLVSIFNGTVSSNFYAFMISNGRIDSPCGYDTQSCQLDITTCDYSRTNLACQFCSTDPSKPNYQVNCNTAKNCTCQPPPSPDSCVYNADPVLNANRPCTNGGCLGKNYCDASGVYSKTCTLDNSACIPYLGNRSSIASFSWSFNAFKPTGVGSSCSSDTWGDDTCDLNGCVDASGKIDKNLYCETEGGEEWIELYNANVRGVSTISGIKIYTKDGNGNYSVSLSYSVHGRRQIRIAPQGFYVINSKDISLDFRLPSSDYKICAIFVVGGRDSTVGCMEVTASNRAINPMSYGRITDGAPNDDINNFQIFSEPTKGFSNSLDSSNSRMGIFVNEISHSAHPPCTCLPKSNLCKINAKEDCTPTGQCEMVRTCDDTGHWGECVQADPNCIPYLLRSTSTIASYSWSFGANQNPPNEGPMVVSACDGSIDCSRNRLPSPSPWSDEWNDANYPELGITNNLACLNATIYARFTQAMDPATLNTDNIKLYRLMPDFSVNPPITVWSEVPASRIDSISHHASGNIGIDSFSIKFSSSESSGATFMSDQTYLVFLSKSIRDELGRSLIDNPADNGVKEVLCLDYYDISGLRPTSTPGVCWAFHTRSIDTVEHSEICDVGCVNCGPDKYFNRYYGDEQRYDAYPISLDNSCIMLNPNSYAWYWSVEEQTNHDPVNRGWTIMTIMTDLVGRAYSWLTKPLAPDGTGFIGQLAHLDSSGSATTTAYRESNWRANAGYSSWFGDEDFDFFAVRSKEGATGHSGICRVHNDFTDPIVIESQYCSKSNDPVKRILQSPSPWKGQTDACINASIFALFSRNMQNSSLLNNDGTIKNFNIYECGNNSAAATSSIFSINTPAGCTAKLDWTATMFNHANRGLSMQELVDAKINGVDDDLLQSEGVQIFPNDNGGKLAKNSWYRIVIHGGYNGVRGATTSAETAEGVLQVPSSNARLVNGAENWYYWYFKTGAEDCPIDQVAVLPQVAYMPTVGEKKDYLADPYAANCNHLNPSLYTWKWDSLFDPILDRCASTNPDSGDYIATVCSRESASCPADPKNVEPLNLGNYLMTAFGQGDGNTYISAAAEQYPTCAQNKWGAGELQVGNLGFTVSQHSNTNCLNTEVSMSFSRDAISTSIWQTGNIALYPCDANDANCSAVDPADSIGITIQYPLGPADDPNPMFTNRALFMPDGLLTPNTTYRVVVKGGASGVKSSQDLLLQDYNFNFTGNSGGEACDPTVYPWRNGDPEAGLCDASCKLTGNLCGKTSQQCTNTISTAIISNPTAYCNNECRALGNTNIASCGNGAVEPGEDCDDSNITGGDGCSSRCLWEGTTTLCGNGRIDKGEQCDDGKNALGDGCSDRCLYESDYGTSNASLYKGFACGSLNKATTTVVISGQSVVVKSACQTPNSNGCNANCLNVDSEPKAPICGNGKIEFGEECDDGRGKNVDGNRCGANCLLSSSIALSTGCYYTGTNNPANYTQANCHNYPATSGSCTSVDTVCIDEDYGGRMNAATCADCGGLWSPSSDAINLDWRIYATDAACGNKQLDNGAFDSYSWTFKLSSDTKECKDILTAINPCPNGVWSVTADSAIDNFTTTIYKGFNVDKSSDPTCIQDSEMNKVGFWRRILNVIVRFVKTLLGFHSVIASDWWCPVSTETYTNDDLKLMRLGNYKRDRTVDSATNSEILGYPDNADNYKVVYIKSTNWDINTQYKMRTLYEKNGVISTSTASITTYSESCQLTDVKFDVWPRGATKKADAFFCASDPTAGKPDECGRFSDGVYDDDMSAGWTMDQRDNGYNLTADGTAQQDINIKNYRSGNNHLYRVWPLGDKAGGTKSFVLRGTDFNPNLLNVGTETIEDTVASTNYAGDFWMTSGANPGRSYFDVTISDSIDADAGSTEKATLPIYTFFCNNPWPDASNFPFIDSSQNCTAGNGDCINTNFATYYCRDAGVEKACVLGDANKIGKACTNNASCWAKPADSVANPLSCLNYTADDLPSMGNYDALTGQFGAGTAVIKGNTGDTTCATLPPGFVVATALYSSIDSKAYLWGQDGSVYKGSYALGWEKVDKGDWQRKGLPANFMPKVGYVLNNKMYLWDASGKYLVFDNSSWQTADKGNLPENFRPIVGYVNDAWVLLWDKDGSVKVSTGALNSWSITAVPANFKPIVGYKQGDARIWDKNGNYYRYVSNVWTQSTIVADKAGLPANFKPSIGYYDGLSAVVIQGNKTYRWVGSAWSQVASTDRTCDNKMKEFLFSGITNSADAIGLRVYNNNNHFSPTMWYVNRFFPNLGDSLTKLSVDGYGAAQEGRTTYINAADYTNLLPSPQTVYTNMYLLSYSQGAGSSTLNIYGQLLANMFFNAGAENDGGLEYSTALQHCSEGEANEDNVCFSDMDCVKRNAGYCKSIKGKITRDTQRLADLQTMYSAMSGYYRKLRCSTDFTRGCNTNADCLGGGACGNFYPNLRAGTYITGKTYSNWPSWQDNLAKEFGVSLPVDPINKMWAWDSAAGKSVNCSNPFNSVTCWDQTSKQMVNNSGTCNISHESAVYAYYGTKTGTSTKIYAKGEAATSDTNWRPEWKYVANLQYRPFESYNALMTGNQFCSNVSDTCGNGTCNSALGETCSSCPVDCGCTNANESCRKNAAGAWGCRSLTSLCNDGVLQPGEECDHGTGCSASCQLLPGYTAIFGEVQSVCGDGLTVTGEDCEFKNGKPWIRGHEEIATHDGAFACTDQCKIASWYADLYGNSQFSTCGDGLKTDQEACDCGTDTGAIDPITGLVINSFYGVNEQKFNPFTCPGVNRALPTAYSNASLKDYPYCDVACKRHDGAYDYCGDGIGTNSINSPWVTDWVDWYGKAGKKCTGPGDKTNADCKFTYQDATIGASSAPFFGEQCDYKNLNCDKKSLCGDKCSLVDPADTDIKCDPNCTAEGGGCCYVVGDGACTHDACEKTFCSTNATWTDCQTCNADDICCDNLYCNVITDVIRDDGAVYSDMCGGNCAVNYPGTISDINGSCRCENRLQPWGDGSHNHTDDGYWCSCKNGYVDDLSPRICVPKCTPSPLCDANGRCTAANTERNASNNCVCIADYIQDPVGSGSCLHICKLGSLGCVGGRCTVDHTIRDGSYNCVCDADHIAYKPSNNTYPPSSPYDADVICLHKCVAGTAGCNPNGSCTANSKLNTGTNNCECINDYHFESSMCVPNCVGAHCDTVTGKCIPPFTLSGTDCVCPPTAPVEQSGTCITCAAACTETSHTTLAICGQTMNKSDPIVYSYYNSDTSQKYNETLYDSSFNRAEIKCSQLNTNYWSCFDKKCSWNNDCKTVHESQNSFCGDGSYYDDKIWETKNGSNQNFRCNDQPLTLKDGDEIQLISTIGPAGNQCFGTDSTKWVWYYEAPEQNSGWFGEDDNACITYSHNPTYYELVIGSGNDVVCFKKFGSKVIQTDEVSGKKCDSGAGHKLRIYYDGNFNCNNQSSLDWEEFLIMQNGQWKNPDSVKYGTEIDLYSNLTRELIGTYTISRRNPN